MRTRSIRPAAMTLASWALLAAAAWYATLASPLAADETPRAKEATGKTIKLFNGKDLDGWTYYLRDENAKMEDVWSATDEGVLICAGRPIGYIRTKDKFTNFVLELEWRFDKEKQPGNSGVLLRMVGQDKVWPKSVEAQLHHQNAGDIWNIDQFPMKVAADRTMGRRTVKLNPTNEKPQGEWNHYRIVMDGGNLKLYVNGELQNQATEVEEVAGYICLQSEGAEIQFRNIYLTPLD